jgi:secondary thiamine-phosphate synthase enzyme
VIRLQVRTTARERLVELTGRVQDAVTAAGIAEGLCHVFVPHTTAAVTVNENADPAVADDFLRHLRALVPADPSFAHAEGNSDAHIKASLVGSSVTLPVAQGRAQLGRWQGVYLCEFDGPRLRELIVTVTG